MVNDHCDKVLNSKLYPASSHKSSFSLSTKLKIKGSSYASPSSFCPHDLKDDADNQAVDTRGSVYAGEDEEEVVDTGFFSSKRSSSLIDFTGRRLRGFL